jgi:hypothetical protein
MDYEAIVPTNTWFRSSSLFFNSSDKLIVDRAIPVDVPISRSENELLWPAKS